MTKNTIQIKALYAGCGKTTYLVKLFLKLHLKHSIILSPSNKGRQMILRKLKLYSDKDYSRQVLTVRKFKKNYIKYESNGLCKYFTITSKEHFARIPYNIFIDEASMLSSFEIKDLMDNWPITNLILCGDCLQFEPIAETHAFYDSNNNIITDEEGNPYSVEDVGDLWNEPVNQTIIFNKQLRSVDEKLNETIQLIKNGQIGRALNMFSTEECKYKESDWHIAYTKAKCKEINNMYKTPKRFIVVENCEQFSFYKGEIYTLDENILTGEGREINIEKLKDLAIAKGFEFDFNETFKPAYAVNAHKLQGSSIDDGDIYIYLTDILFGMQKLVNARKPNGEIIMTMEQLQKIFHRFIYVAVSRARVFDQIHIVDIGLFREVMRKLAYKAYEIEDARAEVALKEYVGFLEQDPLVEKFPDDAEYYAADEVGPEIAKIVYDDDWSYERWRSQSYDDRVKRDVENKVHAVPHKPHKPHKTKYTDEFLLNISYKELRKLTKNRNICKRWKELHK